MAWKLSGTYVASCSCALLCPCPTDGPPTGPDGQCRGVIVFQVREGSLDDTDLSGINFGMVYNFPSNLSAGNWKFGILVSDNASDGQVEAIERIMRGQEGGMFGELAGLVSDYLGTEKGEVTFSNGDKPTGSISGSSFTFEGFPGPEGSGAETTVKNAMFGFAPEFRVGKTSGSQSAMGIDFDARYGETADYEFSSEPAAGAPRGRA
jgi:hypothetical protein